MNSCRHLHGATLMLVAGLMGAGMARASEDIDCSKEAFSAGDNEYCADKRLARVYEQLNEIDAQIATSLAEQGDDETLTDRRGAKVSRVGLYRASVKSWDEYAWARCNAVYHNMGANRWPAVHISTCWRLLAEARIRELCSEEPEVSLAGNACPGPDKK